ncbi:helix-turn-helix transcriptional regulator [Prevotella brunnea]|uniref:Helix-turn-helix transcriptional regulator n=1 Tax=Prevotella brunnea TaxID=2508867 RepID=A0A5C8GD53_9BACT|nr:helix-turn-helix transcriptional regulator [Prevotella brunnea]MDR0185438.1 helix-turn-helix transcriptional regulator [Prevotella brunnea]TXJ59178.1 helix-turn-helix transcriptional regulator [Prevotella brunnea]
MEKINRIKGALADVGRTGKWLAEQLGKDPATVSKWCTNTSQPDLQTLTRIAEILDINIKDLLVDSKNV